MFIESSDFETWMKRVMERFDRLENKMDRPDEQVQNAPTIDGERLYNNQDLCLLFNVCKRTLQRYRTLGWLNYKRIDQKAYYTESDVKKFIEERAGKKKRLSVPQSERFMTVFFVVLLGKRLLRYDTCKRRNLTVNRNYFQLH